MSTMPETNEARHARVAAIFHSAGFLSTLGIALDAVGPDWCETSLTITDAHRQQHGYVHAGVVTTLADHTAGGAARAALPARQGRADAGTEDLNFLLPGRSGRLEARGRTLRAGRTVAVAESEVFAVSDTGRELIRKAGLDAGGSRRAPVRTLTGPKAQAPRLKTTPDSRHPTPDSRLPTPDSRLPPPSPKPQAPSPKPQAPSPKTQDQVSVQLPA